MADIGVRRDLPDSVHQMRVAARRLRSALATFAPLIEPEADAPEPEVDTPDPEVRADSEADAFEPEPPRLIRGVGCIRLCSVTP